MPLYICIIKTSNLMQMKKLLGERVALILDNSGEVTTPGGIIIPKSAKYLNDSLQEGIVVKKGTGTLWNKMDDVHLKQRLKFKKGSGMDYEETDEEGVTVKYLILSYSELWFT